MNDKPGKGLAGWLGRQVAHVKRAIATPVDAEKVIHKEERIETAEHPTRPELVLRRTVKDEVIEKKAN